MWLRHSSYARGRLVTHLRLRKFNTRDAYPEQTLDNDLCMAVRAGNTVYLRGQTAQDLDGTIVGIGDPAAQTENAMKCVKILLEEAGARLEHITKITIYITDRAYREPVYQVVGKWLRGVYPVSTGLIVQGLARPEYLMEIDVIAEIPSA
jgi:enamine deaminase RidA (YjgF/YER057c/UK114 family)